MYSEGIFAFRVGITLSTRDPIARAFELARQSTCRTASEIRTALQREGFTHLDEHFSGKTLSKQLNEVIRQRSAV
jgi:hypothetical protein